MSFVANEVGSGYYRRCMTWTDVGMLDDGTPHWEYVKWIHPPTTRKEAVASIKMLNMHGWQYAMLRCTGCGVHHNQAAWTGEFCENCNPEAALEKIMSKPKFQPKEGDIWQLPKAGSPMWTKQWGYKGSSTAPYIISHRSTLVGMSNGATTTDGWACSCPNFTRKTPRVPCKHILNVMIKEGLGGTISSPAVKMANVDDAKLRAFQEWERQQAALKAGNKPTAGAKLALFGVTTRKFR